MAYLMCLKTLYVTLAMASFLVIMFLCNFTYLLDDLQLYLNLLVKAFCVFLLFLFVWIAYKVDVQIDKLKGKKGLSGPKED